MMFFMAWMAAMIFIVFFAPSLSVLALGEAMCGISWGVFQTLSTTYASEVSMRLEALRNSVLLFGLC
jgi:MFS transporter, SP family, general alpha glucoside:H+ symporter